jgi:Tfp pilus assembly protein FimT
MFIISIMLVFVMPEFSHRILRDDSELAMNRIILNILKIKHDAISQNKNLYMCFNMENNNVRIGEIPDEFIPDKDQTSTFFTIASDISIDNIILSGNRTYTESELCIRFYKKGYSDQAVIHLSDRAGKHFSLFVQPFLHKIQIQEGYADFD